MASPRPLAVAGALLAAITVLCGAFGAHGLETRITPERLAVWNTACDYLAWHAVAFLAIAARLSSDPGLALSRLARYAVTLLLAGILIFSGSLFLLVLTGVGLWGAVTPIGGTALVFGWLTLASAFWRHLEH